MNYIDRSLRIVRGEIESNNSSFNHAFLELKKRQKELIPLFNECIEKGISMQDVSPELTKEWNDIALTLANKNLK